MQMFTGQKTEEVQYQNVDYDEIQKRDELIQRIKSNELDDQEIEVEVEEEQVPSIPGLGPDMEDMGLQLGEMFSSFMPKKKKIRKMKDKINSRKIKVLRKTIIKSRQRIKQICEI